ncbi:CRISPR-associated protein Cas5 [Sphingomonas albertensis]|uniref:CRISPR-associated protein Cas5 n=1 Tax=Sphingomonas albertensis TaxID=2762591 RepID=UPI0037D9C341
MRALSHLFSTPSKSSNVALTSPLRYKQPPSTLILAPTGTPAFAKSRSRSFGTPSTSAYRSSYHFPSVQTAASVMNAFNSAPVSLIIPQFLHPGGSSRRGGWRDGPANRRAFGSRPTFLD